MPRNRFLLSLDYFFVLRPILFFPGWSTMLAGYLILSKRTLIFDAEEIARINLYEVGLLFGIFAMAMGASFLLNQLEDIESDLKNKKLFILAENHITVKAALIEMFLLTVLAILAAFSVNTTVLIFVVVFMLITGYMYNYAPFHLKDRPIGSLVANALMGWLAFAIGWAAQQELNMALLIDALPYLFFNTSLYFLTTLPDVPGDRKSNKKTLAVLHGVKVVIVLALITYFCALLFAGLFSDWFALTFMLATLPFYFQMAIKKDISSAIKTTKYAILFFGIAVSLKVPVYFIFTIVILVATRLYFKHRFNYNYPNLKGE